MFIVRRGQRMIGSGIAKGGAKNHKVFSRDADEGCEQRGSFRKVTREQASERSPVRPHGQAPEAGNRDHFNR